MEPRETPDPAPDQDDEVVDGPVIEQQDWDDVEGADILPDGGDGMDDDRFDVEKDGEPPDENDDNAYQESDEALPDDEEERAISRDPSKQGGHSNEE